MNGLFNHWPSTHLLILKKSASVSHSVLSGSVTPWTVALQAPLSMEFFRQEYWIW